MVHALQGQLHPIDKTRQLQRKLYQAAKACRERRFHALYDRIYRPDVLWRAWREVKANGGSAGIDSQSIEEMERQGVTGFLKKLHEDLREGRYRPQAVKRVYIPKPDGRQRPLGIPTVRDRIVQQACRIVIEPLFEANFQECSFGFRPRRSARQAVSKVRGAVVGNWWVIDADIQGFFDHLDHDMLLFLVGKRISDRRVIKLIRGWLKVGVMEEGVVHRTEEGTPQGGVISPLLANIYLHVLDRYWVTRYKQLGELVRYADDFVIICRHKADASEALRVIRGILGRIKLTLHPAKTRLVHVEKEGFDFLGYHFRKCKSRRTGKLFPSMWPNRKSMSGIRSKVRELTSRRWLLLGEAEVVNRLNPIIRGWRQYFAIGNATRKLQGLEEYVNWRLWRMYRRRLGRRGTRAWNRFLTWKERVRIEHFYLPGKCGRAF